MSDLQAIFFDFDGVLLDTEPVHCGCWAEMLATVGITLSWEYYRDYCIGIDDRDMLRALALQADPPRDWESLWTLYPAKKKLFQERMAAPPFEQKLVEILPALHRDYRTAVVSSSSASEIEPLLAAGGILEHFDTIVGGEMVKRHKPAPEPYLLAAERLSVERALVLEDSAAGIASGKAAGFEVLPVKHPNEVAELLRARLNGKPARTGGVK
ncbi:MAG TPA: HAD family phosphatase [Candidatus Acidoferrales bacterium]|nr:HAD family phosphatase [Candidatus Acidoferrales bacterium]